MGKTIGVLLVLLNLAVYCTAQITTTTIPNLLINEVMPNAGSSGDWLEVFNNGSTPVNLTSVSIRHIYSTPSGWWQQGSGQSTLLPPSSFTVFTFNPGNGSVQGLQNDQGMLELYLSSSLLDSVSYNASSFNSSWSQFPVNVSAGLLYDGFGTLFYSNTQPTPGASNVCPNDSCYLLYPGWSLISIFLAL